jgi:hypothetical protein
LVRGHGVLLLSLKLRVSGLTIDSTAIFAG